MDNMTADNMEIIDPITSGRKLTIDSANKAVDNHECVFSSLDEDSHCIICGKTLDDYIAEDPDPSNPRVPIILVPGGQIE